MSFSSRRRNYLLIPHRRDALIEWMKSMLMHSFVLDLDDTFSGETFSHFEQLIDEHRKLQSNNSPKPSRLKQLVPTVGTFHTPLPLRRAFEIYNAKHHVTRRKHIQISFNEIRHILNLAQVMAMRTESGGQNDELTYDSVRGLKFNLSDTNLAGLAEAEAEAAATAAATEQEQPPPKLDGEKFNGPTMITFDGDQTLYSDGSNFDSNPRLANYLYLLLRQGVSVAVVTAAGYEYNVEKYEFRLSGLLQYFKSKALTTEECERFFLFGGECNYLLHLGSDYRLHPVKEFGRGGWKTATKHLEESPANWSENEINSLLDVAERTVKESIIDLNIRGRIIRKLRSVGLVPVSSSSNHHFIPREALDETVLRCQTNISAMNDGTGPNLPFCAFNGGRDVWVDVGNKRVGVQVLGSYLGVEGKDILHIGDQFLNTGNDYAARAVCPCIWITSPDETTYILKTILRLGGVSYHLENEMEASAILSGSTTTTAATATVVPTKSSNAALDKQDQQKSSVVDFAEMERRTKAVQEMDVYTGEIIKK